MESAKISNKNDKMKSAKLSSTVLDYYYKYGQNRDLEKYLRLRRQSSSKSSSDSSLKNFESTNQALVDSGRIVKSMEKLHLNEGDSPKKDAKFKKPEIVNKKNNKKEETNDETPIKIEKKTQQTIKGKTKTKSYNLNLESNIEINIPSSTSVPSMLTMPIAQPIPCIPKTPINLSLESAETQTEPSPTKHTQTQSLETYNPDKFVTANERSMNETTKSALENETSPASSVASAKVRLEWDSMADIGYNRIIDFKSQSNSNLTTYEKNALTKFFEKRGLHFDDNLIILASSERQRSLQKRIFTQSAIEMHDAKKISAGKKPLSPATSKHLWEKALEKYRDKYGKLKQNKSESTNNEIDCSQFTLATPPHHSTPVVREFDIDNVGTKQTKNKTSEKSSQTVAKHVEAIGIQVEQPSIDFVSKPVQTEYCMESRLHKNISFVYRTFF